MHYNPKHLLKRVKRIDWPRFWRLSATICIGFYVITLFTAAIFGRSSVNAHYAEAHGADLDDPITVIIEEPAEEDPIEEEAIEEEPTKSPEYIAAYNRLYQLFTPAVKIAFCQMEFGEAEIVESPAEKAMCYCVVFHRYGSVEWFGGDFISIITKEWQFTGYDPGHPVTEYNMALLEVVIDQWIRMQLGETPEEVGWPIPTDILYWSAGEAGTIHEGHNRFYKLSDGPLNGEKIYWDYTHPLADPYTELGF